VPVQAVDEVYKKQKEALIFFTALFLSVDEM